jgi:Tol biopolymer transport system component
MHNRIRKIIALWACVLFVSGCGAFEIGIEHLPAGGSAGAVDWKATAESLQADATRASSHVNMPQPIVFAEVEPTFVPTVASPLSTPATVAPNSMPVAVPSTQEAAVVAYVQGGDIWVKTLPDGEARRLTRDGRNQAPRWSASGEWLSFLKDREFLQLWIMRSDGSGGQIGNMIGDRHAWSPVEDIVAFGETGALELLMPETGIQTPLGGHKDMSMPPTTISHIGKIAWSPDGQQLAFVVTKQPMDGGDANDGLWVVDADEGVAVQLLEGNMPEQGEIILHGWSGDGRHLLYWQAPILSASILADGVPLYAVPVDGGEPIVIADTVLVHDDAVQVQPGGEQVAIVAGAGRAVWTNKTLKLLSTQDEAQEVQLSLDDQSAAFPAWSPDGEMIAYVGMPDATHEMMSGAEAESSLSQRRLWVVEADDMEPRSVISDSEYRAEAPQWVDNTTLLFARLDVDGRASLWTVGVDGTDLQQVVDEITPAPEWFGFYGHIDWSQLFAVWRPAVTEAAVMTQALLPTVVPLQPATGYGRALAPFLEGLDSELTSADAISLWGEPDAVTENGLVIYQYDLADGLMLKLAFPDVGPLSYAQLESASGRRFMLMPMEGGVEPAAAPLRMTPTPTPASMDASSERANDTPTPESVATATPLPTVVPPVGTPTVEAQP